MNIIPLFSFVIGQWVEERVTRKCPLIDSSTTRENKPLVETRAHVCCERRCKLVHLRNCQCKGTNCDYNQYIGVMLPFQDLFVKFELISCVEMTLGGDVQLSVVDRLKWNVATPSLQSKGDNEILYLTTISYCNFGIAHCMLFTECHAIL